MILRLSLYYTFKKKSTLLRRKKKFLFRFLCITEKMASLFDNPYSFFLNDVDAAGRVLCKVVRKWIFLRCCGDRAFDVLYGILPNIMKTVCHYHDDRIEKRA